MDLPGQKLPVGDHHLLLRASDDVTHDDVILISQVHKRLLNLKASVAADGMHHRDKVTRGAID
jgi:hypothetical protein